MSFIPSKTDKRRVIIVDYNHLAYAYAFSGATCLSTTVNINGTPTLVNTTIPAYTIKVLHRWANKGYNPLVVCFDSQGSMKSKKYYFASKTISGSKDRDKEYKAGRARQSGSFYDGINLTQNLLNNAGVCCLRAENYEADDLIKLAVDAAKIQYPDLPIDIITGDQDLVPLVDEQVSVFLRSSKLTWAVNTDIEKKHYVQLTPENYQDYMESLTDFKNLKVPYNTALLKKLLRGKKADNIPAMPKMTPIKYNNLISALEHNGYDLSKLCVYDAPESHLCYKSTGLEIPKDLVDTVPKADKMMIYSDPPKLTELINALSTYLTSDELEHVHDVYIGVNLNGAFINQGDYSRRPARLTKSITGYDMGYLQQQVSALNISIPM